MMTSDELDCAAVQSEEIVYPLGGYRGIGILFHQAYDRAVQAGYARLRKLVKAGRIRAHRYQDRHGRTVTESFERVPR